MNERQRMALRLSPRIRATQTRVGNEVARNQLASRQPRTARTSPLCLVQSHPTFAHSLPHAPHPSIRDPRPGTVHGPAAFLRSVVSTRTPRLLPRLSSPRPIITLHSSHSQANETKFMKARYRANRHAPPASLPEQKH